MKDVESQAAFEALMRQRRQEERLPASPESVPAAEAEEESQPAGDFALPGETFWTAFVAASADLPAVIRSTEETALGLTLSSVRPVLARHGLALTQFFRVIGTEIRITTVLIHASGEALTGRLSFPAERRLRDVRLMGILMLLGIECLPPDPDTEEAA